MVCRWIFFILVEEVGTRESKGNYVKEGRRVRSTITEGDETMDSEGGRGKRRRGKRAHGGRGWEAAERNARRSRLRLIGKKIALARRR